MNETQKQDNSLTYLQMVSNDQNVVGDEAFIHMLNQPNVNPAQGTLFLNDLQNLYASENELAELNVLLTSWNLVELYGFCIGIQVQILCCFLLLFSIHFLTLLQSNSCTLEY